MNDAINAQREAIAQSPMKLARDWKTVEEQIGTAQRDDLLTLLRDYLVINSSPGNDLAPLYIARIDAILAVRLDEAAIRADGAYLDFFEKNTGMELSCSWEDDDGPWQVHNVTGGRNDREWTLVGQGRTPREAIASAIRGGKQP